MDLKQKPGTALITGASSGLGLEFAKALGVTFGWNLILVARRRERLEQLRADLLNQHPALTIELRALDLTDDAVLDEFLRQLQTGELRAELLINNAGFGTVGAYAAADIATQLNMVALNCKAPLALTSALLEQWGEALNGKAIINVCSIAAFQPVPFMNVYAATKSFLLNHSLALHSELSGQGLHVQALCPGPTPTEFFLRAGLSERIDYLPATSATQVVKTSLRKLHSGKLVVVPGVFNKFLSTLSRVLPTRLNLAIGSLLLSRYR